MKLNIFLKFRFINFPLPITTNVRMENLFGPKLTSQEGEVDTVTALKDKVVGLYFSAHWCPPCRSFTPELAKTYKLLTEQGKNFEIVFVSSDNDDSGFTVSTYF